MIFVLLRSIGEVFRFKDRGSIKNSEPTTGSFMESEWKAAFSTNQNLLRESGVGAFLANPGTIYASTILKLHFFIVL